MTLTDGDKAIIHDIALQVAQVLKSEIKEYMASSISLHVATCTTKAKVLELVNKGRGAFAVVVVVASVIGAIVARVLDYLWH